MWIFSHTHTHTLLTTCLCSRGVWVPESNQCRLHQLREEDVLTHQHKLSVAVAARLAVRGHAPVRMLDHTVNWDHQTWQRQTEEETIKKKLKNSKIQAAFSDLVKGRRGIHRLYVRGIPTETVAGHQHSQCGSSSVVSLVKLGSCQCEYKSVWDLFKCVCVCTTY